VTTPSARRLHKEIVDITSFLVQKGFADDQNFPTLSIRGRSASISFPNAENAAMLKNVSYRDLYREQLHTKSYNLLMLDGAIIQIAYDIANSVIARCRLAFLPSPDLESFQNDPELYEDDVMYVEVISRQVVAVPIRFEFDDRAGVAENINHPKSHVTLGQYKNCRIAASAPLTPGIFVEFVLRSFYNTAFRAISGDSPCYPHRWARTITKAEAALMHIAVP
jgi:hypothetical protein